MANVNDISQCMLFPLEEALRIAAPETRAILYEGGQTLKPRPMLWPCEPPPINAPHEGASTAHDVEAFFVRDVRVGGYGGLVARHDYYIFAWGVYPGYVRHWLIHDIDAANWAYEGPPTRRIESAIVVGHFNLIYGHWLLEVMPKLLLVRRLAERGVKAPLLFAAATPAWILRIVAALLPDHEVVTYDHRTECVGVGTAILPGMFHHQYDFNPALNVHLDALVAAVPPKGPTPEALFVSRAGLPYDSYRRLTNVAAIERVARDAGLSVVHPERLSWFEQIRLFSRARLIAGEFGSGLHNALFAPAGADVVALNWIVEVQSRIATFRGQQVGYVLPADGRPREFTLDPDPPSGDYLVDPDEFAARLSDLTPRSAARRGAPAR